MCADRLNDTTFSPKSHATVNFFLTLTAKNVIMTSVDNYELIIREFEKLLPLENIKRLHDRCEIKTGLIFAGQSLGITLQLVNGKPPHRKEGVRLEYNFGANEVCCDYCPKFALWSADRLALLSKFARFYGVVVTRNDDSLFLHIEIDDVYNARFCYSDMVAFLMTLPAMEEIEL